MNGKNKYKTLSLSLPEVIQTGNNKATTAIFVNTTKFKILNVVVGLDKP